MIKQSGKFTYREYFYALDLNSLVVKPIKDSALVSASVKGVWFKRENGLESVCMGTVRTHFTPEEEVTPDYFMEKYRNGRYGGSTKFKWDGTKMWSEDNIFTKMVEAHDYLDPILKNFIENQSIPEGYDGWYSIKD